MLKDRGSRLERQGSARLHGGFSWSKMLVAAAVLFAICIIFLNSKRILNVDLHGGSRMRLRVKQGLPFAETLPGAEHEGDHPWYASAEQHPAAGASDRQAEASLVEAAVRNARSKMLPDATGDELLPTRNNGQAGSSGADTSGADTSQQGTPLDGADVMQPQGLKLDGTWQQQRMLERVSSDANRFVGMDASGYQEDDGKQDAVKVEGGGRHSGAGGELVDSASGDPSAGLGEGRQGSEAESTIEGGEGLEGGKGPEEGGENRGEEEDTWMVKIYKEMEQKSKEEVKDPALENGSRIFELDPSEPTVQRLISLLRQMDPASADSERDGWLQDSSSSTTGQQQTGSSQLKLVGLFRDVGEAELQSNPKLATWEEDLAAHAEKLEEAKQEERALLQREQAALHLAIPKVTGVLDQATATTDIDKEEENRPARVDDLLEGEDLEDRLREEGRLEDILKDPELIPDWNSQFAAQQAAIT